MLTCRTVTCFLAVLLVIGAEPPPAAADDDIQARIAAAGGVDDYDADAVVVVDWKDVLVRPNGIGTAREHKVTKVLRDGAIRRLAAQTFPFDPNTNRLELVAIRVYRADGKVEEVPVDTKVQQPQTSSGMYWGGQQYVVSLPRLAVDDAVETITELTGFNVAYLADGGGGSSGTPAEVNAHGDVLQPPVPGHWHDEAHFWTTGYPIIEKRYSVRVPKDKPLQYEVYSGELRTTVTFDETHITYSFEKKDVTPLKSEPYMEPWPNVGTKLLLATLPTWEDKARWLCEVSEPQFEADDAIRAKVAEIIAGLKTDEEKYTALNHWVAENVRWVGTSRGMSEGYTTHDIKETFRDRAGVCKDKAGMLVGMLRVAGYDSYLVMTMARQRVDPIPADQFNHAVTCIRWPDGSLKLLDPTWMVNSRDNWSTLEPLQHVVYGIPEGKELSQSPYFTPEECQASWQAETVIDGNNGLSGKVEFTANGTPEGRLRRTLAGFHPDERGEYFDRTFQRLSPNAKPTSVSLLDPADYSAPLWIKCDFKADNYALGNHDVRYLKLPLLQTVFGDRTMYDLFWNISAEERDYGIKLLATRRTLFEETITLPAGWEAVDLPEAVDIDGPSAGLHFEIQTQPGLIQYTCDLRIKSWIIPPDGYANYKEVMDKFKELAGHMVACELEGARAQR
ncbi:MAG: DUF3857 domain-containing transglutaminase family protein [Phycisphaerae bacterium]|nr:DUF3857 domain-containing transglutaminase family protein [Phycisphaerae bacterium]